MYLTAQTSAKMLAFTRITTIFSIDTEIYFQAIGFFVMFLMLFIELKKDNKFNIKQFVSAILLITISSLIVSRIWYSIIFWQGPSTILQLLNPLNAGQVSFGMILGGFIGLLIYLKYINKEKKSLGKKLGYYADKLAIS